MVWNERYQKKKKYIWQTITLKKNFQNIGLQVRNCVHIK